MDPDATANETHEFELHGDEHDLDTIVEALDQKRIAYEKEGKYEEAEATKQKLEQIQDQIEHKHREDMKSRQLSERLGVEEAHMKELQEFNLHWDGKVAEFETHAAGLQSQLQQRHAAEFNDAREKFHLETEPRTPRWSRELLNNRKIQDTLAKMKKYAEAAQTKKHADAIEARETEAWRQKRDAKIRGLEEQFLHKQALEMRGLTKRIVSGREEQKQARKLELERLLRRYHNVKSQLESQQKIAAWRYERQTPRTRPSSAMSQSMSISSRHSYVRG
eukprot:TRINITY_DN103403_c0_g1_i1.p1 TRINITY_DN103403_c0_g1~~TRINITY_DN103403_c0_g1_i1.p1  ORF type:complete len:297 (-),score=65.50 TRINITY_DN103403_c0_g1_i1:119-949(-)